MLCALTSTGVAFFAAGDVKLTTAEEEEKDEVTEVFLLVFFDFVFDVFLEFVFEDDEEDDFVLTLDFFFSFVFLTFPFFSFGYKD